MIPAEDASGDIEIRPASQRSTRLTQRLRPLSERARRFEVWTEMVRIRILPSSVLSAEAVPDEHDPADWRFLRRPALLGMLALISVVAGASLPSSPFKLEMPGAWFFGEPRSASPDSFLLILGLVAVYGGLVLFMRVWFGLHRTLQRRPGVPVKYLVIVLAVWILPLMLAAPLFSRDVYSYAAQGEMVAHHINPYHYGPDVLGAGPYVSPVDPLWGNTPAPYGPLFLMVDGFLDVASLHHELVTVIFLRIFALSGIALIAWSLPKLARAYNRDASQVFVLGVLNPLVLLHLVGGAHNDAVMVGLIMAGLTVAKCYRRPALGVLLCTLAAAIKAPAALGILYIAWDWSGTESTWRDRLRPLAKSAAIGGVTLGVLSVVSGLGVGWIANLATPGTVRSWLAPATGIGMGLGGIAHFFGLNVSTTTVLSLTRSCGLLAAVVLCVWLLKNINRFGALKAFGLSMLLFVVLGPVVQPWYLSWGLVLLAPIALGRLRNLLVVLSILSPFIGLPSGRPLIEEIAVNPLAVAMALLVLLAALVTPLDQWSAWWSERRPASLRRRDALTAEIAG